MRLVIILSSVLALMLVGGLAYCAIADVPIEKEQIRKTIPNERFFDVN